VRALAALEALHADAQDVPGAAPSLLVFAESEIRPHGRGNERCHAGTR
jgi:hypothetical protein